ncbi:DUF6323 family protein [Enterococcus sp. BWR-S5]|uniref:DUF6323 family protein n=1 Tax=Enterococcus sp. BWR-S5 TaxID=2787714 RepID=UPI001922C46C|nr:DUF6323 family protein [Enterococcus sp. BWR-S5]MBL1225186.1 hypothetical protein [Enterococcus sp. BWR-S5]
MDYTLVSLFNDVQPMEVKALNQLIQRQELHLSQQQFQELTLKKAEALEANHLIDLSAESQSYIAVKLAQSTLITKENYLQYLVDLQESFYFLRASLLFSYSDEDLLEKLLSVFEEYEGAISPMQGVLEEWAIKVNLEEGAVDGRADDSI